MSIFRGPKEGTLPDGSVIATQTDIGEALTAAQQAQAAAEAAQAAADATLDDFETRYLGAKSSDPTVDNDGDALLDGALYFNSTEGVTKIYDKTNTTWLNLLLSASDQADVTTVSNISGDVSTVAGISSEVTNVSSLSSDVTTVSGIENEIITVSGVSSDVASVSEVSIDVSTVANISSDVTTVADNVTDVTNFADVYIGPATSDPTQRSDGTALQAGDLYFNTTDNRLKVYDGTAWEVTARDDSDIKSLLSAGGDLSYNSSTGEFSVTTYKSADFNTDFSNKTTDDLTEGVANLYYADSLVDSHLTGGTGVTYTTGNISIGQDVGTTADVAFNSVTANQIDCGSIA